MKNFSKNICLKIFALLLFITIIIYFINIPINKKENYDNGCFLDKPCFQFSTNEINNRCWSNVDGGTCNNVNMNKSRAMWNFNQMIARNQMMTRMLAINRRYDDQNAGYKTTIKVI